MIKGHAKIELKDEVTGEVTVAEQDNMVTNALAELAKPFFSKNGLYTLLNYTNIPSIAQSFFGGLMLFEEPLSTDPDDFIWPFANPCTGFASNIAYSGTNLKMGGYNIAESGWQEDGSYKHVWDFATDSGNGTIASLGLTHSQSARIGLGSLVYDFGVSSPHGSFFDSSNDCHDLDYNVFQTLCILGGYIYWVPASNFTSSSNVYNNGGVFTICRTAVPVGSVRLATGFLATGRTESFEVQLPSDFTSQFTSTSSSEIVMGVACKDGIVTLAYISRSSYLPAGDTRKLCHINLNDNMSITTTTFTNTTGEQIYFTQYKTAKNLLASHDYCIAKGYNTRSLYVINTNDCTDIKRVHLPNGEVVYMGDFGLSGFMYADSEVAVVPQGAPGATTTINYTLAINLKTGEASYLNLGRTGYNNFNGVVSTDDAGLLGAYNIGANNNTRIERFINPFFLTTKNNLDAPVTKTATQSMKITYTLREG